VLVVVVSVKKVETVVTVVTVLEVALGVGKDKQLQALDRADDAKPWRKGGMVRARCSSSKGDRFAGADEGE
jgi:hypothetical protein